jgi:tripartite-type tricarboxylate transporter receptor subunit TctC
MKALTLLVAVVLGTVATVANAAWPDRPIHLIVPYPPGGGTDLLARVIGAQLEKTLGQPVIVENKPGGSTIIGTAALTSATPDGYTLGMVFDSLAINAVLGMKTPYDPDADFAPIIKLAYVPLVLTVNTAQVPMKTLPELVAYTKKNPGWFTFGSLGPGSPHEIGFLWLKAMSQMDALVVPYKGIAPALQDLVAGQIKGMFVGVAVADAYIAEGRLRTLGVTSPQRLINAPDVPTIAEQGYPEYDFVTFYGLSAPKGTPPDVVDRLNKEINRILQLPDVRDRIEKSGAVAGGGTQQEFAKFLTANITKFDKIMSITGDKPK